MYIYKVKVVQQLRNSCGEMVDASFTEYVQSFEAASYIVKRFNDVATEPERHVSKITVKQVWVQ